MAGSSQCAALALQKVTVPGWTATPLAVTWAVSVMVVPEVTEAGKRVSDVVVGVGISAWQGMQKARAAARVVAMSVRERLDALIMGLRKKRWGRRESGPEKAPLCEVD
jgi:hypothetical protein